MIEANDVGVAAAVEGSRGSQEYFDRQFWEDELEMPLTQLLEVADNRRAMAGWAAGLDGRQASVLCQCLGEPGLEKLKEQHAFLKANWRWLRDYHLVEAFAFRKARVAIQDVALTTGVLPKPLLGAAIRCAWQLAGLGLPGRSGVGCGGEEHAHGNRPANEETLRLRQEVAAGKGIGNHPSQLSPLY